MKMFDKVRDAVGLGTSRSTPPPRVVSVADGILVTERKAEAWFELSTSNTDLATVSQIEQELRNAITAADKVLARRACHLKIVWGRIDGAQYAEDARTFSNGQGGAAWAQTRAERIDELNLPNRHVLLGVHLSDREVSATSGIEDMVLGTGDRKVGDKEMAYLDGLMRKIGRGLQNSVWRARPASVETIAWMIGREQHRVITSVPREGTLTGASVARLVRGRVVPYSDHVRIHDSAGNVVAFVAVMAMTEFPTEMSTPGDGEWLRSVSDVTLIDDEGEERPVIVEASVRFRLMPRHDALKMIEKTRVSAKEQRRSASRYSAEETSDAVTETEETMRELASRVRGEKLSLVEDHDRIIVTESTYDALQESVEAVSSHYANLGITCEVAVDEQRDAWLETLPGDLQRIPDLGHVRDTSAFFGSWFWGGSSVGEASGPAVGVMTGSTPGIVRFDVCAGSARGDATTTAYIGRSGRGKSTAMAQALLDAAASNAWVTLLDFKGDLTGVARVAQRYGIKHQLIEVGSQFSGAADLFRVIPGEDAVLAVHRQLMLLAPHSMKGAAETILLRAVTHIAEQPNPSSWAVIQHLCAQEDPVEHSLGVALRDLAKTPLGSTVAGPLAEGVSTFRTDPGLWIVQLPKPTLPQAGSLPEQWDTSERVAMACLRGFLAWVVYTMGISELRTMRKVVGIPEVHTLTATNDGAQFLDSIARTGRALGGSLAFDTQDASSINALTGLVEQITNVFAFAQVSDEEKNAALRLLGMETSEANRNLIAGINSSGEGEIRHGHCVFRDFRGRHATLQWDLASADILHDLDTNPNRIGSPLNEEAVDAGELVAP